jgi:16S rRNA (guanine966-N2)-methyltransferase
LFNWLAPYINGANCLDLYAGSGILSLEALSRGAAQCTALDNNRIVTQQLMANCDLLSAGLTVINADCANFLTNSRDNAQFDVAFVDPPFAQGLHTESCRLLEQNGWLKDNALIYCELPSSDISFVSPPNWELQKDKIAGGVRYMLYSRIEPNV